MRRRVPRWCAALGALGLAVLLPHPGQALADDPITLPADGRITDRVGALQGRTSEVATALNRLYDARHLKLFVAYVNGFSGRSPQDWANATATRSGLGRRDILLAVATRDRQYAVSADQDAGLSQPQLDDVSSTAIEPALRQNDWAGAAVGAANGYDAVLAGRPVSAPAITPGSADPGGTAASNGAADLWIPVGAVAAAGVVALYAVRRRRAAAAADAAPQPAGTGPGPGGRTRRYAPRPTPLPELDSQARRLLVATDDAVRTSQEDVGFAADQSGEAAARPFTEAVDYARGELGAAFRLRQQLDDAFTGDDGTRRQMLDEILSRCTQANRRLDAESEAFDRLRAMEANVPQVLERAEAKAAALPGRIAAAEAALATLAGAYADSAVEPVAGHPAEARERLEFARSCLDQARAAIGTDHGRAAVFVRAAEGALGQATTLADSVTRRADELRTADATLRAALTGTRADLQEARGLLHPADTPPAPPADAPRHAPDEPGGPRGPDGAGPRDGTRTPDGPGRSGDSANGTRTAGGPEGSDKDGTPGQAGGDGTRTPDGPQGSDKDGTPGQAGGDGTGTAGGPGPSGGSANGAPNGTRTARGPEGSDKDPAGGDGTRTAGGAGGGGDAGLRGRVARAEAAVGEVRKELARGRYDPIAALRRVAEADAALYQALAGAREREAGGRRRAGGLLGQALLGARSEVAVARDVITTHRGAIGSQARTRLAEAERRLKLAATAAPGDTSAALAHAQDADRLAREARRLARRDVGGFGGPSIGGPGMRGAVLGGIVLGELFGGGRGGRMGSGVVGSLGGKRGLGGGGDFGGAGPGSFGGGETRGRMGGGGRF